MSFFNVLIWRFFLLGSLFWLRISARLFIQQEDEKNDFFEDKTAVLENPIITHLKLKHVLIPGLLSGNSPVSRWDYHGPKRFVNGGIRHVQRESHGRCSSCPYGVSRFRKVSTPNINDKDTLLALANISFDSYVDTMDSVDWRSVDGFVPDGYGWNESSLRGYIFVASDATVDGDDEDKNSNPLDPSLVIVSIKGSTLDIPPISLNSTSSTADHDKKMDNLFFSCCCGKVDVTWRSICSCPSEHFQRQCQSSCLTSRLLEPDTYYYKLIQIYKHLVVSMYPSARLVWFVGHSLGGALASLMSLSTGWPAVAFESPGEKLVALRLGIPIEESHMHHYLVQHIGNTADPIFMGKCHGTSSPCYYAGYALETTCHVGHMYVYNQSNSTDLANHRLSNVIENFIKLYPVPSPELQSPCQDCTDWTFVN